MILPQLPQSEIHFKEGRKRLEKNRPTSFGNCEKHVFKLKTCGQLLYIFNQKGLKTYQIGVGVEFALVHCQTILINGNN